MKNLINKILICIPIGVMLFIGSAQAAEIIGITNMSSASRPLDPISGLRGEGEMYNFTINGNLAFCLDPGYGMRSGLEYVYVGKIEEVFSSSQALNMKKGWLFYSKYKDLTAYRFNNMAKLSAQVFIWSAQQGKSWDAYLHSLAINVVMSQNSSITKREAVSLAVEQSQKIRNHYNSISNSEANSMQLYVWKPKNGTNNQRLITNYRGDGGPPDNSEPPTCQIDTWSNLATCSNNSSNTGNIYQYAYGDGCINGYTGVKSNIKGSFTKSYGSYCNLYCLQNLTQTYPGNVATAINAGRYLVWPNNNINNNAYKVNTNLAAYPMVITLNQKCKIYVNTTAATDDYNNLWNAMNNAKGANNVNQNNYLNDKCASLQNAVNQASSLVESANTNVTNSQNTYDYCVAVNTVTNYSYSCSGTNRNGKNFNHTSSVSFADCCSFINGITQRNSCVTGSQTPTGTTPPNANVCLNQYYQVIAAQQALDAARNRYNQAVNNLNACNDYGTKFERVKNFINSFNNTCVSANVENSLNFTLQGSSSYNDPTYSGNFELKNSYSITDCQNCTSSISRLSLNSYDIVNSNSKTLFANKVNEVNNRPESSATITKTYDIKEGYYYYVDKKTNKSVHTRPTSNYSVIGFSNMPVSYESKLGKKYSLNLNVSISGTPFDSYINSQQYSCYYKVNNIPSSCVCPEDSYHPGESLDCLISNKNETGSYQYTCADAQKIWCYNETEFQEAVCPPEKPLTCPNDPEMDLRPCINSGKSYTYCYNKYCVIGPTPDPDSNHYYCPAGTSNEGMNLDACVIPMIEKGSDERNAYDYCVDTTCPIGGEGIRIIYRTISLVNPFPSYNADKTISQNGLTTGMFNNTVKGRYPGSNWNSTTVVKNKILNNRNTSDDSVYNKTPLYTIILDEKTIKTIREYNNRQRDKYSDFTLICKKNNSSACVSTFLREYNLISSGTCKTISSNGSNFYTCDD